MEFIYRHQESLKKKIIYFDIYSKCQIFYLNHEQKFIAFELNAKSCYVNCYKNFWQIIKSSRIRCVY
jgi:hypothetical protein